MTDLVGLLDTNILIDVFRAYPPALAWLENHPDYVLALLSLVRMELVYGGRNRAEQDNIIKLLSPYPLVYPTAIDARWAMEHFEQHILSHQVEIIDCFLAAMSARLKLPIYTRNVKDLSVFEGVLVRAPY